MWNIILSWIHSKCRFKIKVLENQRILLKEQVSSKEDMIAYLQSENKSLYKRLEQYEFPVPPEPDWLDNTRVYKPTIQFVLPNGVVSTITIPPQEIYASSPELEKLVTRNEWKSMPLNKKLFSIWSHVITNCSYTYDFQEAYRFPAVTWARRTGDCEDTSALFVTLCKIAGVPADRIFMACGWWQMPTGKIGHAYPIAQMDDDKWYVFETTLVRVPDYPKLFKGSNYFGDWGMANWIFAGKMKPEFKHEGRYQL